MSWDPVHDSRTAFLLCLRAQCSPGDPWGPLPRPRLTRQPALDAASAILLALLDPGLSLAVAGTAAAAEVGSHLRQATGAGEAPIERADFVLVDRLRAAVAHRARRGSPLFPERGATIVYSVPSAATVPVTLSGTGIDGATTVPLPLPRRELTAIADANAVPPTGVDAFIVQTPDVVALPRSVTVSWEEN